MWKYLNIFYLLQISWAFAILDPYLSVSWPDNKLIDFGKSNFEGVNIYYTDSKPCLEITAKYQVPSLCELFEKKRCEVNFTGNFDSIKLEQDKLLEDWGHYLSQQLLKNNQKTSDNNIPLSNEKTENYRRNFVNSTVSTPYSAQLYLTYFSKNRSLYSKSTAYMIGRNAAVTAAHCVYPLTDQFIKGTTYPQTRGWGINYQAAPGAYTNCKTGKQVNPFGIYSVKKIFIPYGWYSSDSSSSYLYDFALLLFDENIGDLTGRIGLVGITSLDKSYPHPFQNQAIHIGGYPSSLNLIKQHKGIKKSSKKTKIKFDMPHYFEDVRNNLGVINNELMKHQVEVSKGQSGSPNLIYCPSIIDYKRNPYSIGITSNTNKKLHLNFSVFLNKNSIDWFTRIENIYRHEDSIDPLNSNIAQWDFLLRNLLNMYDKFVKQDIQNGTVLKRKEIINLIDIFHKKLTSSPYDFGLNMHLYNTRIYLDKIISGTNQPSNRKQKSEKGQEKNQPIDYKNFNEKKNLKLPLSPSYNFCKEEQNFIYHTQFTDDTYSFLK